jgi:hypothetical protein
LLKEVLEKLEHISQQPIKNNKNNDGANAAALATANFLGAPTGEQNSEQFFHCFLF